MTNAPSSNASSSNNSQPASYITKAVYGIAIDPLDDNRFASFGDDMGIRLWDRRWTDPVMTWTEMDAGPRADQRACNVSMIQFSKSRRGVLGSLMKDAHAVRLWDILDHRREVTEQNSDSTEGSSARWSNYQIGRGHSRTTSTASTAASHVHGLPGILPDGPILAHTTTGRCSYTDAPMFWILTQLYRRSRQERHLIIRIYAYSTGLTSHSSNRYGFERRSPGHLCRPILGRASMEQPRHAHFHLARSPRQREIRV